MKHKLISTVFVLMMLVFVSSLIFASEVEPITLRVALHRGTLDPAVEQRFLSQFTEEYPHIEIEMARVYGNELDRLTVEMIAGVAADVFATWDEPAVLTMRRGFSMDLLPFIERDGTEWFDDILPATKVLVSMDGGFYGVPQYQGVGAVFYNRDMFSEAGLGEPTGEWDWDEFTDALRKFSRSDGEGVTSTGFSQFPQWIFFFPWLEQAGVSLDDPYYIPFDQLEVIQVVDYVKELMDRGLVEWGWTQSFLEGRSAMFQSGSWELRYLLEPSLRLGATAPPKGPDGHQSTFANTDIVSINRDTPYPEEAWTFLQWLYREDIQRQYLALQGLQPARLSLIGYWIDDVHNLFREAGVTEVHGMEAFIYNTAFARPQPFFANPNVVNEDINPALNAIFAQNQSPATVLRAIAERANRKLQVAN